MVWTDDKLEFVTAQFEDGHSATAIANSLSAAFNITVTRSAILGKFHRLKLRRTEAIAGPVTSKTKMSVVEVSCKPLPVEQPIPIGHCRLEDLNSNRCRWPFGTEAPYRFCGAQTLGYNSPYCVEHNSIGTEATKGRRYAHR